MLDQFLDFYKFQLISSVLQSIELTNRNIILFFIFYILYLYYYDIYYYINERINKKYHVLIEGKRHFNSSKCFSRYDELYSIRFKAIWYFVNTKLFKLNINSIKEYSTLSGQYNDYGEKVNIDEGFNNTIYVVNQRKPFKLFEDIYCKVKINDNEINSNENNKNNKTTSENTIVLDIFSSKKNVNEINIKIDLLVKEYEEKIKNVRQNKLFIYTVELNDNLDLNYKYSKKYIWNEIEFNSNKNFDNLFFKNKLNFINKIDFFINNKKFYDKNGIPYTLGILLDGPPGTGKTSIIKCLANYLHRHIIIINFNKIKTNKDLYECFFENTYSDKNLQNSINFENKIYIFEDIDCHIDILKKRNYNKYNKKDKNEKDKNKKNKNEKNKNEKNKNEKEQNNIKNTENKSESNSDSDSDSDDNNKKNKLKRYNPRLNKLQLKIEEENNDKLNLGSILNLIDGINETPGRMIIITSNHSKKIDPALKRPGRIDLHLTLDYIEYESLNKMYNHYFNEDLNKEQFNDIYEKNITPAQITNILINSEHKDEFMNKLVTYL